MAVPCKDVDTAVLAKNEGTHMKSREEIDNMILHDFEISRTPSRNFVRPAGQVKPKDYKIH